MPLLAWTIVKSRVAMTGGQIFISTTPYSLNWLYQEFYPPWLRHEDNRLSVFTWASIDNPNFPKDHFEAEKKRLSPEEFARRYCGEFTKMEGLVYDLPKDQIIAPKQINVRDVILGLDFGFHNPAAAAVLKIDADGVVYITDEYYQSGKVQDELENDLRALRAISNFREVYPDPAEPDRVESMRRHGFYVREVDKNVILGIDKVRELIRKRQLFVFETCKNTIDEFNSYRYDPEKPKEEPVKVNDHLMDAIRYPSSKPRAHPTEFGCNIVTFGSVACVSQERHSSMLLIPKGAHEDGVLTRDTLRSLWEACSVCFSAIIDAAGKHLPLVKSASPSSPPKKVIASSSSMSCGRSTMATTSRLVQMASPALIFSAISSRSLSFGSQSHQTSIRTL